MHFLSFWEGNYVDVFVKTAIFLHRTKINFAQLEKIHTFAGQKELSTMTSFLMHFIVLRLVILLLLIITTFFSIYAFVNVIKLKRKVKKLER